jgi:hypothetical protein
MVAEMNQQHQPAFPAEVFIAAGIPRDTTVQLSVNGVFYAFGEIPQAMPLERWPTRSQFMEIAFKDEIKDVTEAEVHFEGNGMADRPSMKFEFEGPEREEDLLEDSYRHPIAFFKSCFWSGRVTKPTQLRIADLAFMTFRNGGLWLGNESIRFEDADFGGEDDFEIMADGHRFNTEEYWCYAGPKSDVFDGLMTFQQRSRCPYGLIPRAEAGPILRKAPERWTAVAADFIKRHGRAQAEAIIGADNLNALLRGELWGRLVNEPLEDKRQLHLWPNESLFGVEKAHRNHSK